MGRPRASVRPTAATFGLERRDQTGSAWRTSSALYHSHNPPFCSVPYRSGFIPGVMTTDYHRLGSPPNGRACSGRGCRGRVLYIWGLLPITGSAAAYKQVGAAHHTTLSTRSICPFSPHRPSSREEPEDVRFPLLFTRCMWLSTLYWHTSSLRFSNPGRLASASRPIRPATVAEQNYNLSYQPRYYHW